MNAYLLWFIIIPFLLHVMEEYVLGWTVWVKKTSGIAIDDATFYLSNFCVLIFGICCAMIGWQLPVIALTFTAAIMINAIFPHLILTITYRRYVPGVLTGILFVFPVGCWVYYGAYLDNVLTWPVGIASFALAGLLSLYPMVLFKLKKTIG